MEPNNIQKELANLTMSERHRLFERFGSDIEKEGIKLTKRGYNEKFSGGVSIACQDDFMDRCYLMQVEKRKGGVDVLG